MPQNALTYPIATQTQPKITRSADCKILRACEYESPTIVIHSEELKNKEARFMIDTGSQLNLIKLSELSHTTLIDESIKFELYGISQHDKPMTSGKANVTIHSCYNDFHVVPDEFPIKTAGIIGVEFLQKNQAVIN